MTDYDDSEEERTNHKPTTDERRDPAAVAKRVARALGSIFHVEATSESGEYRVHSGSGNTYTVNLLAGTCTCPDGQRGPWCKHAYRVLFQTGELPSVAGTGVVAVETEQNDDHAEADAERPTDDEDGDNAETLAARVERFEANNPGASAIEAISQLGIDPDKRERVEEVLA